MFRDVLLSFCERTISIAAVLILSPVFVAVALAIAIDDGWPIFFRQERIGRDGRPFRLVKYRSMRRDKPGARVTAGNDPRVTRVGRFLRRYKLDELPQLWNVIRGDMGLIGPRPEVPHFVDIGDTQWRTVLSVRPGITDLCTLLFRDEERLLAAADDPERYYRECVLPSKLALNIHYIEKRNPRSDLKLLCMSIWYSLRPSAFDSARVRASFGIS